MSAASMERNLKYVPIQLLMELEALSRIADY
jgi:hypothetical protein